MHTVCCLCSELFLFSSSVSKTVRLLAEGLVKDICHPAFKKVVPAFPEAAPKQISFSPGYGDKEGSHCLWSEGFPMSPCCCRVLPRLNLKTNVKYLTQLDGRR